MGYIDVAGVEHTLADGRVLFADVSFRVGEGAKVALVGPNGAGKTTLLRMVSGDLPVTDGRDRPVRRARRDAPVHRHDRRRVARLTDLALRLAAPPVRAAGRAAGRGRAAMHARRPPTASSRRRPSCAYADALVAWGEAGGYDAEVLFDTVSVSRLDLPWERPGAGRCAPCPAASRSGSRWTCCCAGRTRCCCWTSRTTSSTYRRKRWLEARLRESDKSVLYVSHDRELLAQTATRVVTVEGGTRVDPSGRLRLLARGPRGPLRTARRAAPALGRGAPEAQGPGAHVQAEGGLQRRAGLAVPGGPDPAAQVRGGRPAPAAAQGAGHPDAARRWPYRQAGGRSANSSNWRT